MDWNLVKGTFLEQMCLKSIGEPTEGAKGAEPLPLDYLRFFLNYKCFFNTFLIGHAK